jgi:hypothetical protein
MQMASTISAISSLFLEKQKPVHAWLTTCFPSWWFPRLPPSVILAPYFLPLAHYKKQTKKP